MNPTERTVFKKPDAIIGEMLEIREPVIVKYHYNRLMKETENDDLARTQ